METCRGPRGSPTRPLQRGPQQAKPGWSTSLPRRPCRGPRHGTAGSRVELATSHTGSNHVPFPAPGRDLETASGVYPAGAQCRHLCSISVGAFLGAFAMCVPRVQGRLHGRLITDVPRAQDRPHGEPQMPAPGPVSTSVGQLSSQPSVLLPPQRLLSSTVTGVLCL